MRLNNELTAFYLAMLFQGTCTACSTLMSSLALLQAVVAAGMGLGALGTGWLVLSRKGDADKKGAKGNGRGPKAMQADDGPVVQAESRPIDGG